MKKVIVFLCGLLGSILYSYDVMGQSLKDGEQAFAERDYQKAVTIFTQLKETNAKILLGHTYMLLGEYAKAESTLKPYAKQRVLNACYYYGILCMRLYRFDEALTYFNSFLQRTKNEKMKKEAQFYKSQCQRANTMLENVEGVEVIDSLVVDKREFVSALRMSKEYGTIYPFNTFFQGSSSWSSVYETLKKDRIIYGKLTSQGDYNLYMQTKLVNNYGDEVAFPQKTINTEYDENFPFLSSDGVTLYFSSNNPEKTIGGYDILITQYSSASGSYLMPENLGMPFNSPANDYMYLWEDAKGIGWVVSDRFQPEDKVCFYLFHKKENSMKVEGINKAEKIKLASWRSIRSTWKQDNYNELLSSIYQKDKAGENTQNIFFPITNTLVYHSVNDFKSKEAKGKYNQSLSLSNSIEKLEKQLEKERNGYSSSPASSKGKKKDLILALEDSLFLLYDRVKSIEKECRNLEIKKIQK